MIKAAKGESIEELDDIDKEIALFVKGLEAENVNSIKKSKTYVDNIIKHSLLPLYQLIANKLEQFNQLFMVDKKLFRINKIISQSSLKAHETAVNTMDEVISIEYFFIYEGFLKSQKDFSVNLIYKAIFRNNSYDIIESSKSKLSIKKIYTEQLTELEMTEIANQIAKSILEEIKSKIKLKS